MLASKIEAKPTREPFQPPVYDLQLRAFFFSYKKYLGLVESLAQLTKVYSA